MRVGACVFLGATLIWRNPEQRLPESAACWELKEKEEQALDLSAHHSSPSAKPSVSSCPTPGPLPPHRSDVPPGAVYLQLTQEDIVIFQNQNYDIFKFKEI